LAAAHGTNSCATTVAEESDMAMTSIRCSVLLGAHVTRVTDFEGNVIRIICRELFTDPAGLPRSQRVS
jgi:hypothetical protein